MRKGKFPLRVENSNFKLHIRIYVLPFWNFTTDPKCYTTPTTERQRHLERRVCVGRGWFNALLPNCANKWQSTITFSPSLKAKKVWHCFHSSLVSSAALCTLSVSYSQCSFVSNSLLWKGHLTLKNISIQVPFTQSHKNIIEPLFLSSFYLLNKTSSLITRWQFWNSYAC